MTWIGSLDPFDDGSTIHVVATVPTGVDTTALLSPEIHYWGECPILYK